MSQDQTSSNYKVLLTYGVHQTNYSTNRVPFSDDTKELISSISRECLAGRLRRWPDLVALGFWSRPGNIKKMERRFKSLEVSENSIRKPRGTVTVVSPNNVEVLWVYTWLISTLLGNQTIVRVPSKFSEMSQALIELVAESAETFPDSASGQILSCERDSKLFDSQISNSEAVVAWGGDTSVLAIRDRVRNPNTRFIGFPDRQSSLVVKASSLLHVDDETAHKFVEGLLKDVSEFGQQACSSPRRVFWVGEPADNAAASFRLRKLLSFAEETDDPSSAVLKRNFTTNLIASGLSREGFKLSSSIDLVAADFAPGQPTDHPGLGLLLESEVESVQQALSQIGQSEQSLSYYGIPKELIVDAIRECATPIRQVVPLGRALDFDFIWDGLNLIAELTRPVRIS